MQSLLRARQVVRALALLLGTLWACTPTVSDSDESDDIGDEPDEGGRGGGGRTPTGGKGGQVVPVAAPPADAGNLGTGGGAPADARAPANNPDALPAANEDATVPLANEGPGPDPVTLAKNLPAVVPVLWFDTGTVPTSAIQRNVDIKGKLKIIEDHDGTLANVAQRASTLETPMSIEGRGNFTWSLPKKPYNFEIQNEAGENRDLSILGLPKGSDFSLLSCYTDKTCLRNAISFAVAQEFGRWAPRTRFVEVYLNGNYQGLYLLTERIRHDKARAPVAKPAATAAMGDLTGGYVIHHEGNGKGPVAGVARDWVSVNKIVYTYLYPRYDAITPEQKTYIQGWMNTLESTFKNNGDYRKLVDIPSWVDQAVIEEFTNNWDGYVHSIYMQKQPDSMGGRLLMAPPWDYDLAFGNGNVKASATWNGVNCKTDSWAYMNPRTGGDTVPFYWHQLLEKDAGFRNDMTCRWRTLRKGPLDMAAIDAKIVAWVKFTASARKRDQAAWPTLGKLIFPNCVSFPTYEEEVAWVRKWIADRLSFLDANLPGTCGG